jgi:hypothetical protein
MSGLVFAGTIAFLGEHTVKGYWKEGVNEIE